jgi:hypothetical protein
MFAASNPIADPQQFVAHLDERARRLDWSPGQVAGAAGVAPSTWYRWRKGQTEPELGKLRRVADAIAAEERRQAENQHGGTSDTGDGPGQALIPDACRLSAGTGSAE